MEKKLTPCKVENQLRRYRKVQQFAGKLRSSWIIYGLFHRSRPARYDVVADSFDEHLEFFSEIVA